MKSAIHFSGLTLFVAVICFFSASLEAQGLPAYPVTCPAGDLQVQYLVEKKASVLLLCKYTPDAAKEGAAPYFKNVSGKTKIVTEDGKYALLKTYQIPVRNEADIKYAYIKAKQPELNCILEFEKFPYDEPFDMVEEDKESTLFTAKGLSVDKKTTASVNVKDYLALTPYYEHSYHFENGVPVYYFHDDGIELASTGWRTGNPEYEYLSVGFRIVNKTKEPISIKNSDVTASAVSLNKRNREVKCNLLVMDFKKANQEWKDFDELEIMNELPDNPGTYVANAASRAAFSPGVSTLASFGLFAFGIAARAASKPSEEPYMKERNEEREETMKLYLTEATIQPGDTLSTFVSIKYYKSPKSTSVSLSLNGETYKMEY